MVGCPGICGQFRLSGLSVCCFFGSSIFQATDSGELSGSFITHLLGLLVLSPVFSGVLSDLCLALFICFCPCRKGLAVVVAVGLDILPVHPANYQILNNFLKTFGNENMMKSGEEKDNCGG